MNLFGTSQPKLFRLSECALLKITLDGCDLLFACALQSCRQRMGRDGVFRAVQHRHAGRDQFLIPAGKSAVTQKRLKQSGLLLVGFAMNASIPVTAGPEKFV